MRQKNREVAAIDKKIAALYEQKEDILNRQKWQCCWCKKWTQIKRLDVVRTLHWDHCEDWAYSHDVIVFCLKCQRGTRYWGTDDPDRFWILKNQGRFGGRVVRYHNSRIPTDYSKALAKDNFYANWGYRNHR